MLRKLLNIAVLLTIMGSMNAQTTMTKMPHEFSALQPIQKGLALKAASPQQKEYRMSDSEMWWGYVNSQQNLYLRGTYTAETYEVAIFIPASDFMKGVTLNAIRFAFQKVTNLSNFKIWMTTKLGEYNITSQNVTAEYGFNEIAFEKSYTMGSEGVYVGYSFDVNKISDEYDNRPIAYTDETFDSNGYYMRTSTSMPEWTNMKAYGVLGIQVAISGSSLPSHAVAIDQLKEDHSATDSIVPVALKFYNHGTQPVSSFDFAYTIDGKKKSQHVTLDTQLPKSYNANGTLNLKLNAPSEAKLMKCTFQIEKVNGVANEQLTEGTTEYNILGVAQSYPRKMVVEELTTLFNGYVPRGIVGMKLMREKYPDTFIGVAIHQEDTMSTADYAPFIQKNTYDLPVAVINRNNNFWIDPYMGKLDSRAFFAYKEYDEAFKEVSEAQLNLATKYTDDSKTKVSITSSAMFSTPREDCPYAMAYILVEDSVSGKGKDWAQQNYYPNLGSSWDADDMKEFTSGATEIEGLKFNDVALGIWDCYGIEGSLSGTVVPGQAKSHNYEITLPSKVQNKKNLRVISILINRNNGRIVNAQQTYIGGSVGLEKHSVDNALNATIVAHNGLLVVSSNVANVVKAEIYTVKGELVATKNFQGQTSFDANGMKGLYIVRITNENGVVVRKVVL